MKYEPYPISGEAAGVLGKRLFFEPHDDVAEEVLVTAFVLTPEGERTPYLAVFRKFPTSWCDFALFSSAGWEEECEGRLVWGKTFSSDVTVLTKDDEIASGFHKFDGCRQFDMHVHEDDDEGLLNTLSAVMTAAQIAGKLAGYYEEDWEYRR